MERTPSSTLSLDDSGVELNSPSWSSLSFSPLDVCDGNHTPKQQRKNNLLLPPKRTLFTTTDLENNKVSKKKVKECVVRECLTPLSERQQIAIVLQLSSQEAQKQTSTPLPQLQCDSSLESKRTVTRSRARSKLLRKHNERGESLLHIAAIKGDVQKVSRLLKQGAEVNATDFAGWSPLHEACIHGQFLVARRLIAAGARINARGHGCDTPLHDAAVNGHFDVVQLLLHHGGDPFQKNSLGKTPVDVARDRKVIQLFENFCQNNPVEVGPAKRSLRLSSCSSLQRSPGLKQAPRRRTPLPKRAHRSSPSTMRKNCPQNQAHKGAEKPTSPRLTLRFQSIKAKDEKTSGGGSKANDVSSSQPKYQTYCVTMETRDVYEFRKDDPSLSSENFDSPADAVTSSKDVEHIPPATVAADAPILEDTGQTAHADSTESCGKLNGGADPGLTKYDYCSDGEKEDSCSKRFKGNNGTSQRSQRVQGPKAVQSEGSAESKVKKKGAFLSSDTETTQSNAEASGTPPPALDSPSHSDVSPPPSGSPHSPKVPPIKIVIPLVSTGSLETEASRERSSKACSSKLPYVVSSEQVDTLEASLPPDGGAAKLEQPGSAAKPGEERFHRVTRSSHRMALANAGTSSGSAASSCEATASGLLPAPSSSSLSCGQKSEQSGESSTDEHHLGQVDLHPRKRKLRTRDVDATSSGSQVVPSSSASSSSSVCEEQQGQASNSYQMYFNIRKQVDKRRKAMFVVHPKPPQGFKDYLLNRCSYVLEGNAASRISVPMIPPPQSLVGCMRDLFVQQEKERYKLRLQHLIEREKLVLSAEQEILRVHGRAARAMANQAVPLSVCTILKDEEIYNILELEQETSYLLRKKALKTPRGGAGGSGNQWNGSSGIELSDDKDKNVRSRYNGRLFLSWLQDVDDKWEKIKEAMLLRHHNEAESLHAVQKLDWEWKLKELTMCDVRTTPVIDDIYVPMVHVSDDFDLLPA